MLYINIPLKRRPLRRRLRVSIDAAVVKHLITLTAARHRNCFSDVLLSYCFFDKEEAQKLSEQNMAFLVSNKHSCPSLEYLSLTVFV